MIRAGVRRGGCLIRSLGSWGRFILGGSQNTHVVVRGIGPSLAQFGLSPVLADPTLELHDFGNMPLGFVAMFFYCLEKLTRANLHLGKLRPARVRLPEIMHASFQIFGHKLTFL